MKSIPDTAQYICTDLSFQVLKYDRLKAVKINSNAKVNYIACDATDLPFISNSINLAFSFFGIANMMSVAEAGIREAHRVLKTDASLLDAYTVVKEGAEGFQMLVEYCQDNHEAGAELFFTAEGVESAYKEAAFKKIELVTVGESIGGKNKTDLIPLEGEWFAVIVAAGTK